MKEYTQSAFSKIAKVSRPAILKAIKTGKLEKNENGKIDADHHLSIAYLNSQIKRNTKISDKELKKKTGKTVNQIRSEAKEDKKVKAKELGDKLNNIKTDNEQSKKPKEKITVENVDNYSDRALDYLSKDELDQVKAAEDIRLKRIKKEKERGELIERSFVKTLFLQLYNIDVNEFLQLSAALSAKVCTVFSDDSPKKLLKVNEIIDKELFRTQTHIKREIDKFLEDMENNKHKS